MIQTVLDVLSWITLVTGGFFYVVGAVGLNRMPDVFTRMHAVSVSDTLGGGLIVTGLVLQAGPSLVAAKLILILLVLLFTGSVASHALARAALHDGQKPLIAGRNGELVALDAEQAVRTLAELDESITPTPTGEDEPSKP